MEATSEKKEFYSAAALAALKLPGFPTTDRAARTRAESEGWEFVEVKSPGKKGKTRKYKPPIRILELIERRLQEGGEPAQVVQQAEGAGKAGKVLPALAEKSAAEGKALLVVAESQPAYDARRDMLEAVLRVGEYKILHNQVTQHVIDFALEGAPSWLEAAKDYPDLELRLRNMVATLKFFGAAGAVE